MKKNLIFSFFVFGLLKFFLEGLLIQHMQRVFQAPFEQFSIGALYVLTIVSLLAALLALYIAYHVYLSLKYRAMPFRFFEARAFLKLFVFLLIFGVLYEVSLGFVDVFFQEAFVSRYGLRGVVGLVSFLALLYWMYGRPKYRAQEPEGAAITAF